MTRLRRYKEFGLGQLRAFRECVREKSFSAAARSLGISQPAIWQQVRALERDLGTTLFQRRGRDWEPTEDGRILLEQGVAILATADSLREVFQARRAAAPRTLFVIGTPGVVSEDLAGPVAEFCRQQPQVRLSLISHSGLRTLDQLLGGQADVAILPAGTDVVSHRQFLTVETVATRKWVLATPAEHPLTRKRRVTLADIVKHPLILPEEGSGWRQQLDQVFKTAGLASKLNIVLEASMTLAVRRFVSLGVGIALIPLPTSALPFPEITFRRLGEEFPPEEIVALWRRGSSPRPQARAFVDFVREQIANSSDAAR